jgi:hypothetical protein
MQRQEHCDFKLDSKVCRSNPDLTFIYMAITYFSNYLDGLTDAIFNAHQIAMGRSAKVVDDFMPEAKVKKILDEAGFIVLFICPNLTNNTG